MGGALAVIVLALMAQGGIAPSNLKVAQPLSEDTSEFLKTAYVILDSDVAHAAMLLQKLMAERPADLAVRRLAERLPPMRKSVASLPT